MRIVLQRSKAASVTVDGEVVGEITHGYTLLVGITHEDTKQQADWLAAKIAGLRLFEDEEGKMNRSLDEVAGQILSVSQFTLYGDSQKGRRPSFIEAARPEVAEPLWLYFNDQLRSHGFDVQTGVFGAMMDVSLINDGPVTLILEK
ncbi:D-tyrosyl-tRNA(Tyr) deacylase [Chryseomicrobium aureum]|uniref:D-aminoacyl-tRNA deacylase n=1 Tax=Chryseomicrobium aureum TaxID=1441723 RepID=UPI00195757CE|nr:D-aminoacyl-tRNA deacylase [Chryseomicrobium aureum]MBM7706637.1 D-tyrosyl-tRNA(Tyr) deacylase [Chryseomicrobium aureum]